MDKLEQELFANAWEPWVCARCGKTYIPMPDDENTHPAAVQTKLVPVGDKGEMRQVKSGDICATCMGITPGGQNATFAEGGH